MLHRVKTYSMLRAQARLSDKRSPALEQSQVARVMMWIGAAVMSVYFIILGSFFGYIASDSDEPAILLVLLPMLLVGDFLLRFMAQQTPLVFVKPMLLMPMRAQTIVEAYLIRLLLNGYNLMWLTLFLPYTYVALWGGVNALSLLAMTVGGMLLVMANSQWYLLVRTLVARSLLWWLLPVGLMAAVVVPVCLQGKPEDAIENLVDQMLDSLYAPWQLWLFALAALGLLALLFAINRATQLRFIRQELSREQKGKAELRHVAQFAFLEHFGQTGEYLKLELKSIMRNKAIRSRVMMSLGLIVVLSALISYTDVYDGALLLNFWCYYCFALYGMTALTKVMGPEGNYIDLLLTQRENILMLLRAKYYFHVAILLVPLLIMLPAVIAGKFTPLMMAAYLLLTSGLGYAIMFQLAVYNKQTLPLDQKVTGKNGVENGLQLLIEMVGMFLPLLLVAIMILATDETTAYTVLALLGLMLTIAHPLWLRNIYKRMMRRKYENLEGFHASR